MRWAAWSILFFSAWLISSPFVFGFEHGVALSDILSGFLAASLSISYLQHPRGWKNWAIAFTGIWLFFAPLVFWTRNAATYANDTLIGTVFILFSVVAPSETNPGHHNKPPGWSYNPSSWHHRIPVVILAFLGFFVARTMAAFQLGHIQAIWDPFFGDGTKTVLTSKVAEAFPISDAGLGAATYLIEGLTGLVGNSRRWQTMPWMVFLFFVLVVPAGVVSIVLIMLQPVVVGAWCTLCLITAILTLISIPPAVDEIFASWQFLAQSRSEGKSVWRIFWHGEHDHREKFAPPSHKVEISPLEGLGMPWNLFLSAAAGVWIIVSAHSNADYILGALVITMGVLASAEPIRPVRYINVLFALVLIGLPLFTKPESSVIWNHIMTGVALVLLSFPKGKIKEEYGSWNRYIV